MSANDEADQTSENVAGQSEGCARGNGTGSDAELTGCRNAHAGGAHSETPSHFPARRPRSLGRDIASVGRFFWTHNPFYLISAFLVFYGLYVAFSASPAASSKWWLLGLMVGYTALLGFVALAIVRWGKVWDDARSIILIVILLFLAVSVSLDEIGIKDTPLALPLIVTAFTCAVTISQTMLWGMKIRLGKLYLISYYVILAISFFHPLAIMLYQEHGDAANKHAIAWGLLTFPLIQGLAFLTLMPGIRRGQPYTRDNGTPWRWPGFPLVIFAVLWGAVCVRHFCMAGSFMPADNLDLPFGLYSICPLLLCGAAVLLELGLKLERRGVQIAALVVPIVSVIASLSPSSPNPVYADILEMVKESLGSPVLLSLGAAVAFYIYAALRRVRGAEWGLVAALLAGSFIDGETIGLSTLAAPRPLPLLILAAVELIQGFRKRTSSRLVVGLGCLIMAAYPSLSEEWPAALRVALAAHAAVLGVMGNGLICSDRLARRLLSLAAFMLALMQFAAFALHSRIFPDAPAWLVLTYSAAMTALPLGYWRLTRNASFLTTAIVNACWAGVGVTAYAWKASRRFFEFRGFYPVAFGTLSFIAALAISLAKGRVTARLCSGRDDAAARGRGT